MIQNFWANAAFSVIPTILVGLIFWLVMLSIFRADRTERTVYAEIEAEERARFATENAALRDVGTNHAVTAGPTSAAAGSTAAATREPSA